MLIKIQKSTRESIVHKMCVSYFSTALGIISFFCEKYFVRDTKIVRRSALNYIIRHSVFSYNLKI